MTDMDDTAEQEVVSLSGVRRLVLHARDALKRTSQNPGYVSGAAGVEAYAAQVLALHTLTLVADCIPARDLTEDEASELRAEVAKAKEAETEARRLAASARTSARDQEEQAQAWMDDYTELEAAVQRALGLNPDGEPLEVTEYAKRLAALQASSQEGAPAEPSPSPMHGRVVTGHVSVPGGRLA